MQQFLLCWDRSVAILLTQQTSNKLSLLPNDACQHVSERSVAKNFISFKPYKRTFISFQYVFRVLYSIVNIKYIKFHTIHKYLFIILIEFINSPVHYHYILIKFLGKISIYTIKEIGNFHEIWKCEKHKVVYFKCNAMQKNYFFCFQMKIFLNCVLTVRHSVLIYYACLNNTWNGYYENF